MNPAPEYRNSGKSLKHDLNRGPQYRKFENAKKKSDRQYCTFEASELRSNHSIANLKFPAAQAAQATQAAEAAQAAQALQAAQAAQGPKVTKRRKSEIIPALQYSNYGKIEKIGKS